MSIDFVGRTVTATSGNLTLSSPDDYVVINGALGVLVDGPKRLVSGNQMDIDFDARAIRTNSGDLVVQASSRLDLQAGTGGIRFLPLDAGLMITHQCIHHSTPLFIMTDRRNICLVCLLLSCALPFPSSPGRDVNIVLGSSLASATLTRPVSLPGHPTYSFNIMYVGMHSFLLP
jgi:hypothetical protein